MSCPTVNDYSFWMKQLWLPGPITKYKRFTPKLRMNITIEDSKESHFS